MKWNRLAPFLLITTLLLGCCGMHSSRESMTENDRKNELTLSRSDFSIPEKYNKTSESGRVAFELSPEYPDVIAKGICEVPYVRGTIYADAQTVYEEFAVDKKVDEMHEMRYSEASDAPDEVFYIFTDGSHLYSGENIQFAERESDYYNLAAMDEVISQGGLQDTEISFVSREEAIKKTQLLLSEIGLPQELLELSAYALDYNMLNQKELELHNQGLLTSEKMKQGWSAADDAYYIVGYQMYNGVPVYHETMSIRKEFAHYNVENATFKALLSADGWLEFWVTNNIYDLSSNGVTEELLTFEEITSVVEKKYDMLLNDSCYLVSRACFAFAVLHDESQKYNVIPVWYFEVMENGDRQSCVWVDAITGNEIYLP